MKTKDEEDKGSPVRGQPETRDGGGGAGRQQVPSRANMQDSNLALTNPFPGLSRQGLPARATVTVTAAAAATTTIIIIMATKLQ